MERRQRDRVRLSSTEPSAWWNNPVTELPDNSTPGSGIANLATPSEIYVLSASRNSDGYDLGAAKTALVTLAGATLTWNASAKNNTYVIGAAHEPFVWIEAVVEATTSFDDLLLTDDQFAQIYGTTVYEGGGNGNHGFSLVADGVTSSQIRHLAVLGGAGGGIEMGASTTSDHNYLEDVAIESLRGTETGAAGVYLHFGADNLFDGLIVANGAGMGLQLGPYCDGGGGGYNTFVNARVFNNAADGIFVNSHGNHIVDALVVGNGNTAIDLSNACGTADGTVVAGAVVAFNGAHGVSEVDDTMSLTNIVSIGNALYGFNVGDPDAWSNLASSDCGSGEIDLFGASTFAGSLLVTNNASCSNPMDFAGVADGTCAPTGSSTAALYYQGSILGDFVGAVSSDSSNQSAIGGTAEFPATPSDLDWIHFDNTFRVWGRWDSPGPWTTGTGAILDFRLLASAMKIFDNTSAVASRNPPFIAGATCPSAVAGSVAITNSNGGASGVPDPDLLDQRERDREPERRGLRRRQSRWPMRVGRAVLVHAELRRLSRRRTARDLQLRRRRRHRRDDVRVREQRAVGIENLRCRSSGSPSCAGTRFARSAGYAFAYPIRDRRLHHEPAQPTGTL